MIILKNSEILFDDSIKDVDPFIVGRIGDYLTYQNKVASTTKNCLDAVKEALPLEINKIMQGIFDDYTIYYDKKTPQESIITFLNYQTQLKPVILITKYRYQQKGYDSEIPSHSNILSRGVKVYSFDDAIEYIEGDEDYSVWLLKLKQITDIQKMDSDCKRELIKKVDKKIAK